MRDFYKKIIEDLPTAEERRMETEKTIDEFIDCAMDCIHARMCEAVDNGMYQIDCPELNDVRVSTPVLEMLISLGYEIKATSDKNYIVSWWEPEETDEKRRVSK